MTEQSISLRFVDARSDKTYNVQMVADGDGFCVRFQYGRTGQTLTPGSKTNEPVSLEKAQKIYDKLVESKVKKGYKPDDSAESTAHTQVEHLLDRDSGLRVQLLNPISREEVEQYINDPDYVAQQKNDGERRPVAIQGGDVKGINKLGQFVAIPSAMADEILSLLGLDFTFDAEIIGDHLHIFDVMSMDGSSCEENRYDERLDLLNEYITRHHAEHFSVVYTAYTSAQKRELFNRLEEEHQEGIVFKKRSAPYTPSRPNSGGDQLKFKFTESASVIAGRTNIGKRSVAIGCLDSAGNLISVGNVTIPPNKDIPVEGAVVEVNYLYYFLGGSLFQPTYKNERNDVLNIECTLRQLKHKTPHLSIAC